MKKHLLALLGGFSLAGAGAFAEDLDDLFSDPPSDIVTEALKVTPAKILNPLRAFGTWSASVASVSDFQTASLYETASLVAGLELQPDDSLRVLASWKTSFPDGLNLRFSTPAISEIFMDFTPTQWAVFRLGQFGMTWGQARLLSNTANLVSSVGQGVTVKGTFPWSSGGLTLVASGQGKYDKNNVPEKVLYAGSVDQSWGPFTVGMSLSKNQAERLWVSSYVKTAWAGTDWYIESVGYFSRFQGAMTQIDALAGFLWQGGFPTWTINGEYQLNKEDDGVNNDLHATALAVSVNSKRQMGFSPKVQWFHNWFDVSGQVLPSVVLEPMDHFTVTVGVPWVYGDKGEYYVLSNPDPAKRSWALGMKATWSYSY